MCQSFRRRAKKDASSCWFIAIHSFQSCLHLEGLAWKNAVARESQGKSSSLFLYQPRTSAKLLTFCTTGRLLDYVMTLDPSALYTEKQKKSFFVLRRNHRPFNNLGSIPNPPKKIVGLTNSLFRGIETRSHKLPYQEYHQQHQHNEQQR